MPASWSAIRQRRRKPSATATFEAFAFFGGVPKSILYDNTKIVVARILGDGKRQRTRVFTELQSHYLFEDRFGRPGKGNDKGKVEGLVGYARRNFLVPIPVFESFAALNAHLLECCRRRMGDCLRGHDGTIGERLERDLAALQTPLPAPYDACEKVATTVSRCRWCAIGSTTTQCRRPTVTAMFLYAVTSMRW
jgi:Transposase and inactivated derivatives